MAPMQAQLNALPAMQLQLNALPAMQLQLNAMQLQLNALPGMQIQLNAITALLAAINPAGVAGFVPPPGVTVFPTSSTRRPTSSSLGAARGLGSSKKVGKVGKKRKRG